MISLLRVTTWIAAVYIVYVGGTLIYQHKNLFFIAENGLSASATIIAIDRSLVKYRYLDVSGSEYVTELPAIEPINGYQVGDTFKVKYDLGNPKKHAIAENIDQRVTSFYNKMFPLGYTLIVTVMLAWVFGWLSNREISFSKEAQESEVTNDTP